MKLVEAAFNTLSVTNKTVNLFSLAGVPRNDSLRVGFVPTCAKVDVTATASGKTYIVEASFSEPTRPLPTELESIREHYTFSFIYERLEQVVLFDLDPTSGDLAMHEGTTALEGYVCVYQA